MAGELKYRVGQRVFVEAWSRHPSGSIQCSATIVECRPGHPAGYEYVIEREGDLLPILEREIITDLPAGDTLDDLEAWLAS